MIIWLFVVCMYMQEQKGYQQTVPVWLQFLHIFCLLFIILLIYCITFNKAFFNHWDQCYFSFSLCCSLNWVCEFNPLFLFQLWDCKCCLGLHVGHLSNDSWLCVCLFWFILGRKTVWLGSSVLLYEQKVKSFSCSKWKAEITFKQLQMYKNKI